MKSSGGRLVTMCPFIMAFGRWPSSLSHWETVLGWQRGILPHSVPFLTSPEAWDLRSKSVFSHQRESEMWMLLGFLHKHPGEPQETSGQPTFMPTVGCFCGEIPQQGTSLRTSQSFLLLGRKDRQESVGETFNGTSSQWAGEDGKHDLLCKFL